MVVNGDPDFEEQKSASTHNKVIPFIPTPELIKAFWNEAMQLCKKNIHI